MCVALLGGTVLYYWLLADLPPFASLNERMVRPTTQILDRHGRLLYEVLDPNTGKQLNLSLANVPPSCIQATLATEDSRFYHHFGVDPIAVLRAAWQNYRSGGEIVSGGSTLTMQLARNLFLEPEERYTQSLRRKLREAWLALRLERHYTKDELLALYLNQTYYGNFAFGLEAAAQIFFAKPTAQLSSGECTLLAGLVQYPTGYNPLQDAQIAKNRQLTVLRLMKEAGFITQGEEERIGAEPLRYRSRLFDIEAPHFVMYVQDLLARQLGEERLRAGGLQVRTTLDLDLQRQAERSVRYRLDLLNCRLPGSCDKSTDPNRRVANAAAVVLDSQSGEILAMVGSPDYFDAAIQGNVNATLAERQPGSAIKPLTYAAALDPKWAAQAGVAPLTPATIIADLPTTFYVTDEEGGNVPYTPVNYDRAFHGPVSVRTALA
ncbi:MAG: transglycosylase domain-containing protein, partial [Caldilineaceae bacterium]|nr:transglycosylase domain-containing protein [Caldilineaceae bacterium]